MLLLKSRGLVSAGTTAEMLLLKKLEGGFVPGGQLQDEHGAWEGKGSKLHRREVE
ncbi:hypothetical protein [Paenibacillus sonchi]|uniref:hypothetical protein n=1 Tax=Paenibacillus sonchi TaxID=373687 RepID=UPI001E50A155|nr:hypothetical protein [Paenibacillus sonchi]